MRSIVISSGHGKLVRGASGYLDEVDEARKVVDRVFALLQSAGVTAYKFHDDTSTSQNQNLSTIVAYHNGKSRDLDVSVHFNAYQTTTKKMGTEVLYVTQDDLADELSNAMATVLSLPDRGGKQRSDLYFLNNTNKPAILIETCFVDSSADASAYRAQFEGVCEAIAELCADIDLGESTTPPVEPPTEPPGGPTEPPPPEGTLPPVEERPTLQKGSSGPEVAYVQTLLAASPVDSDFGNLTAHAVRGFQCGVRLAPTGMVGSETWAELDKLAAEAPEAFGLTSAEIDAILAAARGSAIASYDWRDRGRAPAGYINGLALAYGMACRGYHNGWQAFIEMATAEDDADIDALAWYRAEFAALGMDNATSGQSTLRHTYMFLMGLGMRESSGKHCEGRDMSADNVTSDTAEAGLFQTSWNAKAAYPTIMQNLFDYYDDHPLEGFGDVFAEGVSCSSSSWQNYGSGDGYAFQKMCKAQPEFAVETAGVVIRNLRAHYGPINRKEVELRREADDLLQKVEAIIEASGQVAMG